MVVFCALKTDNHRVIEETMHWVKGRMAMEFGKKQAGMTNWLKDTDDRENSNRTFCSRLVALVFHESRIDIVHNPDYCSPDVFLSSNLLVYVTPSLQPFNEEDGNDRYEWSGTKE
jgi:hypothetical protein